jgi:indole-3-glycerol phosphate synthase
MHKTILDEIIDWKYELVACAKQTRPLEVVQHAASQAPPPRDLAAALRRPSEIPARGSVSLIAEVKRASPSKGLLRPDLDPASLACIYEANGAAAVSVLTDWRFFRGCLDDLRVVRQHVALPVLRKDFTIDPYQVYEARAAGADAILVIAAVLSDDDLDALHRLAGTLGMSALVEVHDEVELERAVAIGSRIVGVNNRDLHTFQVDLETTARLRARIPDHVVLVAESGVHTPADVARLADIGVDAMLVGEALVRADDVGAKVRELVGVRRDGGSHDLYQDLRHH